MDWVWIVLLLLGAFVFVLVFSSKSRAFLKVLICEKPPLQIEDLLHVIDTFPTLDCEPYLEDLRIEKGFCARKEGLVRIQYDDCGVIEDIRVERFFIWDAHRCGMGFIFHDGGLHVFQRIDGPKQKSSDFTETQLKCLTEFRVQFLKYFVS